MPRRKKTESLSLMGPDNWNEVLLVKTSDGGCDISVGRLGYYRGVKLSAESVRRIKRFLRGTNNALDQRQENEA